MSSYDPKSKDWRADSAGFVRRVTSGHAEPWQYILIGVLLGWIFL
jgi:hypothetical protein